MEIPSKGTVTSLSSIFAPEETQKASKRVQDTIADRQRELDLLLNFTADNNSLVNLVQKLPDELHHDIMVPFGKAAFFPGRLIHTNEFLVLLGEGYYAERTSKQTTDLLKRRGKALESQVESLKAVMQDLKVEASFFDATAAEMAEGLVEIREEYIDETLAEQVSKEGPANPDPATFSEADSNKAVVEDKELANFISRIDELEKEEIAEESLNEYDEDEDIAHMMSRLDEFEKMELAAESVNEYDEDENVRDDFGHYPSQDSFVHNQRSSEGHQFTNQPMQSKDGHRISDELLRKHSFQQDLCKQFDGSRLQSVPEDKSPSAALTKFSSAEKALVLPEVKENTQVKLRSQDKAFTGSIVEHTHNLEISQREQTAASSKSDTPQVSKPVSRFKMQRR